MVTTVCVTGMGWVDEGWNDDVGDCIHRLHAQYSIQNMQVEMGTLPVGSKTRNENTFFLWEVNTKHRLLVSVAVR